MTKSDSRYTPIPRCPDCGCQPGLQTRVCETCVKEGRMEIWGIGAGGKSSIRAALAHQKEA